ncbi:hypothetical protein MPLSOD_40264 [Mesorhizobium sp. SOD10]|nr:hypothetical protein MPLSOD_40264 [Mesorhizobium sp. SOD10]
MMALYWVGIITGRKNRFNRTAPHRSIYIYRRTTIPRGNDRSYPASPPPHDTHQRRGIEIKSGILV